MVNPSAAQDTQVLLPEKEATFEERLNEIVASYQGSQDELIPMLQHVQQLFGYVPEPAIKQIAKFLHLPEVTVYGVATVYAQVKLVPTGRNIIRVCRGTACHVRGGEKILNEVEKQLGIGPGETTPDLEHTLETVACIGCCALSPAVVVNNKVHGRMAIQKVKDILNATGNSSKLRDV